MKGTRIFVCWNQVNFSGGRRKKRREDGGGRGERTDVEGETREREEKMFGCLNFRVVASALWHRDIPGQRRLKEGS